MVFQTTENLQENEHPTVNWKSYKGPVPKTRKFKLYVHSEEFTSDRGSPKQHFDQKTRKNFDPY